MTAAKCLGSIVIHTPDELRTQLENLHPRSSVPTKVGLFGQPPYGKKVIGEIAVTGVNETKACERITTVKRENLNPFFLLLEEGDCPYTLKVKFAQELGASAVILQHSDNRIQDLNLIDDGYGQEIMIGTLIVSESVGNLIQEFRNQTIEASLEFELPSATDTVSIKLYSSSKNLLALDLIMGLNEMSDSLDFDLLKLEPHYVHWKCSQCEETNFSSEVENCLSGGRYCAVDPDGSTGPLFGSDIVQQNLKEICIYQSYEPKVWVNYMSNYYTQCQDMSKECNSKVMKEIDINEKSVNTCVRNSVEGNNIKLDDNKILKKERQKWLELNTPFYPVLLINNSTYYGHWDAKSVLNSACSSFKTTPEFCKQSQSQTPIKGVSLTSVIVVLVVCFGLLVVCLVVYRIQVRKQMKAELKRQVSTAVSQYFALQDSNYLERD